MLEEEKSYVIIAKQNFILFGPVDIQRSIEETETSTWGSYAKWNKPGTERQVLHDLSHMWNLKIQSHTNKKQKGVIRGQGAGGAAKGQTLIKGYKVDQRNKFW